MSLSIWNHYAEQIKKSDYVEKTWDFLSDEEITEFTATASDSGTLTVADTVNGGAALLTTKINSDDNIVNVMGDSSYLTLGLGRKVLYWTRLKSDEVTQCDWHTGLFKVDTALVAAFTDGVYFKSDDGDAYVDCGVRGASVESLMQAAGGSATAGQFYDLLFYIDMDSTTAAKGTAYFYKDGVPICQVASGAFPLEAVAMTAGVELQTGQSGAVQVMTVDFIKVLFTR